MTSLFEKCRAAAADRLAAIERLREELNAAGAFVDEVVARGLAKNRSGPDVTVYSDGRCFVDIDVSASLADEGELRRVLHVAFKRAGVDLGAIQRHAEDGYSRINYGKDIKLWIWRDSEKCVAVPTGEYDIIPAKEEQRVPRMRWECKPTEAATVEVPS